MCPWNAPTSVQTKKRYPNTVCVNKHKNQCKKLNHQHLPWQGATRTNSYPPDHLIARLNVKHKQIHAFLVAKCSTGMPQLQCQQGKGTPTSCVLKRHKNHCKKLNHQHHPWQGATRTNSSPLTTSWLLSLQNTSKSMHSLWPNVPLECPNFSTNKGKVPQHCVC